MLPEGEMAPTRYDYCLPPYGTAYRRAIRTTRTRLRTRCMSISEPRAGRVLQVLEVLISPNMAQRHALPLKGMQIKHFREKSFENGSSSQAPQPEGVLVETGCEVSEVWLRGAHTLNPDLKTYPIPETRNPRSETRNPKPETRNSKPETRNPKSETRNPKPESRNPKPETRNPKPGGRTGPPSRRIARSRTTRCERRQERGA